MTGWNLPPGCNVSDLPGNRPEDLDAEAAMEWADEQLAGLSPDQVRIVIETGLAALPKIQEAINTAVDEARADDAMCRDMYETFRGESS